MTSADTKPAPLPKVGPSDRLGAIVTVAATSALDGADLTNVIVLSRRRSASGIDAPAVQVSDGERPAPWLTWSDRTPWAALFAGVLLLHLVIAAIFMRDPAPMQSLALDSISVDIVLGGQTEAGIAQMPSPAESAPSQPAESTPVERDQPTETVEQVKPELRPRLDDAREPPREAPQPQERKTEEAQTAAVQAEAEPTPAPEEAEPTPTVAETPPPPDVTEPKPVEEPVASQPPPPQEQPTETPREQSKPTPPRVAASRSGVGLGSSREVRDWASRVTAQLARNKRYPGDALAGGIGGTAVIAFAIDSAGNVGAVRLVRSSGNASLDRESRDLVRRAAPFPIPPQGKASITVPVNFNVLTGR
jgi:protein TonB